MFKMFLNIVNVCFMITDVVLWLLPETQNLLFTCSLLRLTSVIVSKLYSFCNYVTRLELETPSSKIEKAVSPTNDNISYASDGDESLTNKYRTTRKYRTIRIKTKVCIQNSSGLETN